MSRKPWAIHRKDATAAALIEEAKALGAQYLPVDGVIDGVLRYRGRTYLVDWKSAKTKLTVRQARLLADGWPIWFVKDSETLRELLWTK